MKCLLIILVAVATVSLAVYRHNNPMFRFSDRISVPALCIVTMM